MGATGVSANSTSKSENMRIALVTNLLVLAALCGPIDAVLPSRRGKLVRQNHVPQAARNESSVSFRTMSLTAYNSFATSADAPLNDPNCQQGHVVLKAYGKTGVGLQSADCKLQYLADLPDNTMGYVTANNYDIDTIAWLPSNTRFLLAFHNSLQQVNLPKDATQLEFADLSFNAIDSLKNAVLPDSLKQLDLSNNKLTSLEAATFPSSLEYLDVSQNPIESLQNVKFPSKLKTLRLGGTKITSLAAVDLNNINTLYLSTIPSGLEKQKKIDTVFFESPDVTLLKELALKPKTLGLDSVTVTTLEGYDFTNKLTRLSLANTPITSLHNVKLSNVKELTLNGNPVDKIGELDFFADLDSLSWINTPLGDTKLPDKLQSLYLFKADVSSNVRLPKNVEQLAFMDRVDVTSQVSQLGNLKSLILSPPGFNAADLKLSRKLEYLELHYSCESIPISGIDFPPTLKSFSFGPCTVSTFEIPERNVKTFEKMEGLFVKIANDGCFSGAKTTIIQGKPFCVLSDISFDQKHPDARKYPESPEDNTSAQLHPWKWQVVMMWAVMTSVWWLNVV